MTEYVEAGYAEATYEEVEYVQDDAGNVFAQHTEVEAHAYDVDVETTAY